MKKILIVTGIGLTVLTVVYLQFGGTQASADPRGSAYAGSKACARCHRDVYSSYLHTAHYIASIPATEQTVHGSFADSSNTFPINESEKVVMEKRHSGLFQTYYLNGKAKQRKRFDIVFGGVKGETYLYWQGNELHQLPLSYFSSQHRWSTSPGYGHSFLDFSRSRAIGSQCMECHASYIADQKDQLQQLANSEQFDKSTLVYSIDCERCHGPGAQHIDFQTNNPGVKTARFITTYKSLSRTQKLDMCAQCHSGKPGVSLRSTFGFLPGDTLAKFKMPAVSRQSDTAHIDVHGNQLQLLQSSKCFIYSKMDCATCHDVHQNTRGNDAIYTQKCVACHTVQNHNYCKMSDKLSAGVLKANCIVCHMPAQQTKVISVEVADKEQPVQFFVHTHHIAIYPQEMKKILAFINK